MKSPYLTFVALIIFVFFVSCSPSNPPPNSNSPLITVEFTGTEARASSEETITQPNCGGSAEAENTVGRSRSIKYEIEVQHGLEVNANGQVGFAGTDVELGATVANQLGHSYGNEETLSRSVTVKASPGTNMVHQIKQEEVWQVGTATVVVGDSQMLIPFSFRHEFSVQLVDSYDRKDCETLVAMPPTEAENQNSPDNVNEPSIRECSFPQTGWTPPELLANGEWIYSCLSAGENNWVGQDESWKAANWERGSGQSEIINIVIPEGATTMGVGCEPCTILKPDGSTISSAGGSFGPFQPNIQFGVNPGEVYKARIFGGDTCPLRPSAVPPCSPEIYIWFNLQSTNICQDIATYPGNFLSEDRVPPGTSMEITVRDGEIHTITAGTIRVSDVSLPGGQDRGSVVILLPSATYNITQLNPTWNWHGAFHLEANENEWESLADLLAAQQMIPGTCSDGDGCSIVDVLIVGPNGVITQYEKRGPLNVNCSP